MRGAAFCPRIVRSVGFIATDIDRIARDRIDDNGPIDDNWPIEDNLG